MHIQDDNKPTISKKYREPRWRNGQPRQRLPQAKHGGMDNPRQRLPQAKHGGMDNPRQRLPQAKHGEFGSRGNDCHRLNMESLVAEATTATG